MKKKALVLSPAALEQLQTYPWPGNVRELQNCIERAVILVDGDTILPQSSESVVHAAVTGERAVAMGGDRSVGHA